MSLVPQNFPVSLEEEFANIIDWSFNNKLTVSTSTRSQAVARIADRTAKNCRGHVT